MEKVRHDLRLSETLSPFGVGAIVDVQGESLIAPDTSWWDKRFAQELSCERLMARLGAGVLRQPPTHANRSGKDTPALPYWRFPAWRFCERCDKISKLTGKKKGKWSNACECGGFLVPMRYVAVCEEGSHIQDINWFKWAHRGRGATSDEVRFCRDYRSLRFTKLGYRGEGLASLMVKCRGCGNSRTLAELVTKSALRRDGIRCDGRQPWESEGAVEKPCPHDLVAVQRGATGNYIAESISALDIPEERPSSLEAADRIRGHMFFEKVVADNGGPRAEQIATWIAEELNVTPETVLTVAQGKEDDDADTMLLDLKDGEWAAFVKKLESGRDRTGSDFVVDGRSLDGVAGPRSLLRLISGVGQVRRVREVRALQGFRRHDADAAKVNVDLGPDRHRRPTYPAIELFGEGIFLRFDEARIAEWETQQAVQARARILTRRRAGSSWAARLDVPEPRYVALHTLAHLLIRRLAFASGYASASLQERIYANSDRADRTAGILIYTAAGDAQGTLGGLVRLGEPDKLIPILVSALDDADFCSNDPVCIESDRQGASQLNLSACHGCSLVSETSCETGNRLLDRQLVLGGSDDVRGVLDDVLRETRLS
ncbi:hypothetical protein AN219_22110 [Streptomyces nanshensis]|nr:hypothetical protein AN219_22110 [Streptomyces nanshensis]